MVRWLKEFKYYNQITAGHYSCRRHIIVYRVPSARDVATHHGFMRCLDCDAALGQTSDVNRSFDDMLYEGGHG